LFRLSSSPPTAADAAENGEDDQSAHDADDRDRDCFVGIDPGSYFVTERGAFALTLL